MRDSVKDGRSVSLAEAKNCNEKQEDDDYGEGKCYYEIVGLKTRNEDVEKSNCWSRMGFETNQFMC
jgi:hypothetical protein